jgi:hypothetical protein
MKPEDITKYTWIAIAIVTLLLCILITLPQEGRSRLEAVSSGYPKKFDTATGRTWTLGNGEWKELGVPQPTPKSTPTSTPAAPIAAATFVEPLPPGYVLDKEYDEPPPGYVLEKPKQQIVLPPWVEETDRKSYEDALKRLGFH